MCPEEWRAAVISRALMRKEAAEERLNDAKDGLELSKAEKQLKSAQWDLERVFQKMYAPKQEVEHGGTKITIQLISFSGGEGEKHIIDVKAEPLLSHRRKVLMAGKTHTRKNRRLGKVCGAKNRRGQPCQCKLLFRGDRCRFHGGMSTSC
jgi:hypothetical protein